MTHFGMICPPATEHLNPMTTLGCELQKRGHRVSIINIIDVRSRVRAAGLEFIAIGKSDFPPGASRNLFDKLANLDGLEAFKYTVRQWMTNSAIAFLRDAPEAIQTAGINALLADQVSAEGSTIAEHSNIPLITVCSALMLNRDLSVPPFITSWNYDPTRLGILRNQAGYALLDRLNIPLLKIIRDYRSRWGLSLDRDRFEFYSSLAQICQQPREFEFPRLELPSYFHFTGPFSNSMSREPIAFPWEKLTGQPLIYAFLGRLPHQYLWIVQAIAQACVCFLNVQLVISLGGEASPESLPQLPGNPIVVDYSPQLELLPKAALTITHAGMNTVLESLSNGLPMVAIPITNDQPGVAARIAWTGTGEVVPLEKVSVENLRRAIQRVLREESYKNNALRLQESIKQAGGVTKAADIIEQTIATGKPVLARATN